MKPIMPIMKIETEVINKFNKQNKLTNKICNKNNKTNKEINKVIQKVVNKMIFWMIWSNNRNRSKSVRMNKMRVKNKKLTTIMKMMKIMTIMKVMMEIIMMEIIIKKLMRKIMTMMVEINKTRNKRVRFKYNKIKGINNYNKKVRQMKINKYRVKDNNKI